MQEAEVIVLDWKLQSGLGIDLLPLLQERGIRLPVVFLTGMPAVASEYAALDLGAVDFVDKARGIADSGQAAAPDRPGQSLPAADAAHRPAARAGHMRQADPQHR
jgi:DNA-binding NtrC family response regulator